MSESKNRALLRSFTSYCIDNPELRFWRALRNWSGHHFILAARANAYQQPGYDNPWYDTKDTFNWEGRDG